jgi:hypothetical protein
MTRTNKETTTPPTPVSVLLSLLLVSDVSSSWSFSELQCTLQTILWKNSVPESSLVQRILEYLLIEPVRRARAIGCSSQLDEMMPLSECLDDSESTWWISKPTTTTTTTTNHKDHDSSLSSYEYVDFDLTRGDTEEEEDPSPPPPPPSLVRLSAIEIKIPPLPQGPCSLYEFRLESRRSDDDENGVPLVHGFLESRAGDQRFPMDNDNDDNISADVHNVRLVCISNQISRFQQQQQHPNSILPTDYQSIGFYAIRFS